MWSIFEATLFLDLEVGGIFEGGGWVFGLTLFVGTSLYGCPFANIEKWIPTRGIPTKTIFSPQHTTQHLLSPIFE